MASLAGMAPCGCTLYIVPVSLQLLVSCLARRMTLPLATSSPKCPGELSGEPAGRVNGELVV